MRRPFLVFDLDGTLIDSLADLQGAANRLLTELGRLPLSLDEARLMVGDGARSFVRHAVESRGLEPSEAELDRMTARYLDHYMSEPVRLTRAYPMVAETLGRLRAAGFVCGVCTNKPKRPTLAILDALGLARHFGAALCPEDVKNRKPDPGHVTATVEALGGDSRSTIIIGDSSNDVVPARALGMPAVIMAYGYSRKPAASLGAALVLGRFDELATALTEPPFQEV